MVTNVRRGVFFSCSPSRRSSNTRPWLSYPPTPHTRSRPSRSRILGSQFSVRNDTFGAHMLFSETGPKIWVPPLTEHLRYTQTCSEQIPHGDYCGSTTHSGETCLPPRRKEKCAASVVLSPGEILLLAWFDRYKFAHGPTRRLSWSRGQQVVIIIYHIG